MTDDIWNAAIASAAEVAKAHKGSAAAKRRSKGRQFKFLSDEEAIVVEAEERGEDIAAEMIEKAIMRLKR